ncbi:pectinesterase inhibitor 9 [Arachis duranensis]|uniref:Pectinesterase inhibitor 9 n=1 Tax=Arachis duranensis TaxID=130453 RepID=A0A6P4CGZ8_ARADU|nr:pectinesterase inhibitor 9 [Arachis duranensis]
MSPFNITFLVTIFLSLFFPTLGKVDPTLSRPKSQTLSYIESSCNGTLYRELCIRSLSKFASTNEIDGPQHLAHVALSISLARAIHTKNFLVGVSKELDAINNLNNNNNNNNDRKKRREYQTIQDCVNQLSDSVDQLSQSIKELRRMNNKSSRSTINDDFLWHINNVETWVSTALTDASSCVYAFPGHRMSKRTASIRGKAMNVAQVTSNALAFIHKYMEAATRNTKP